MGMFQNSVKVFSDALTVMLSFLKETSRMVLIQKFFHGMQIKISL